MEKIWGMWKYHAQSFIFIIYIIAVIRSFNQISIKRSLWSRFTVKTLF